MHATTSQKLRVTIHESIVDVPQDAWDAIVTRDTVRCKHSFLRAVEASRIAKMQFFYPVAYDEQGRIVAHTMVYLVRSEADIFATGQQRRLTDLTRRVWRNFLSFKTMECGSPVALGNCLTVAEDWDRTSVLGCLVKAIEQAATEKDASAVVFRDFNKEELSDYEALFGSRYNKLNHLPIALMNVAYDDFEQYARSIRSKYRYYLKQKQNYLNCQEISTEITTDFFGYSEQFQKLWDNVYRNAKEFKREYIDTAFFQNMSRFDGFDCRAIIIRKDQEIIAFSLLLLDDDTLTTMYVGINYAFNQTYSLYYNLLYMTVDFAIRERKRIIDMGITCYAPKAVVGCHFAPLYIFVRHLHPLLNALCGPVLRIMNPPVTIEERHVYARAAGTSS